jgi:hypothetical protein
LISGKDMHNTFNVKKEREQTLIELNRNVAYFKEKECRSRVKFLTKFQAHAKEKKKVIIERLHEYFTISYKAKR